MSDKLKVAVLGAGGIIGQHMMISVPPGVDATFVRKTPSPLAESLDLTDWPAAEAWLAERKPDVIVNLAGESRVDVVERDKETDLINVTMPQRLAEWCDANHTHLIQVSSQAAIDVVNHYGRQKRMADDVLDLVNKRWTIVRPTFVLGIRPFPAIGRENPAESILRGDQRAQVNNRRFSVSFAWDVAAVLWRVAKERPVGSVIHVGNPESLTRFEVARYLRPDVEFSYLTQEECEAKWGIAPRPLDTTYAHGLFETSLNEGLERLRTEWRERTEDGLPRRARELAAFLKFPYIDTLSTLAVGFGPLHNAVSADFREAFVATEKIADNLVKRLPNRPPQNDDELLAWYRTTDAYLWELTAYHCDQGFNYRGMCQGIITRLKHAGAKRVLCLGDGVGTLTIAMHDAGLEPVYHDLANSRTSHFAFFRFFARLTGDVRGCMTDTFTLDPKGPPEYDAVASLDFLEHVPNVADWVRTIYAALKPGGLFVAQNAFAIGSGPQGDMPMHLALNDRWEKDWDPLLTEVGFVQLASQWYQKPA